LPEFLSRVRRLTFAITGVQEQSEAALLHVRVVGVVRPAHDKPQCCKSRRASESRRQGCRRSGLLQALGNAGSGVLRFSHRVKKMAYNRPDPQVHHWLIPHKVLQCSLDSISIRVSKRLAIFFMQLGGQLFSSA
jgi:hypothetical protein